MRTITKFGMLVCLAAILCSGQAVAETEHTATVAPFKKAPTMDGKLAPGEWDGAISTVGVQDIQNGFTETRRATTYVGFTTDRLYVAVVSEISPAGAFARLKNRDSDVVGDDGIEIWLDPNRDTRASGQGDLRYYQLIENPIGTILDVAFAGKGAPDVGWNAKWEVGNVVDDEQKMWTTEVSVPFTDIGWEQGKVIGRSLGILVARNFKGGWTQSTWFPHGGAFVSWFAYPKIRLTADAPSVQIQSLGDEVFKGKMSLKARIFNPGPARQLTVSARATSSDMPEVKSEKTIDLPANAAADYAFDALGFHEHSEHQLKLVATTPDKTLTVFDYAMKWRRAPEQKWNVEASKPDPEASIKLAYYPSYKFVRVQFDARQLEKEFQQIKSAQVTVTGPGGKQIAAGRMTWKEAPAIQEFPVGDLADGDYTLTVAPAGYPRSFTRTFSRKHFPWENNTLGITDEVLPPFTPIQVKGDQVGVVLREYTMDGLGLWKSVKAAGNVSAGGPRELLAGPMTLQVNGQPLAGKGQFVSTKPHLAVFEGQAAHPALIVKSRSSIEYDGCMKVELELFPGAKAQETKSLVLEIPLQNELMPLWHVNTAGLRQNPAGTTPAGSGNFWDSRKFSDGNWYGNFKPYIWLGAEERGLCWFADNDAGWELSVDSKDPDKSAACLALNRQGSVLTLRVNLIQKPVMITAPRKIVFGLMASPAKPMPDGWRRVSLLDHHAHSMSYLGDNICSAKTPHGGDFSVLDQMQAARRGQTVDREAYWKEWSARNISPATATNVTARLKYFINWELDRSGNKPAWFCYYFDEYHSTCETHPESHIFQSEWTGEWQRPLKKEWITGDGVGSINVSGLVRSHQDFAVWCGAEHVKRGVGLYFDNSFLKRAYDPLTTAAYRLPNGDIQPSAGMWAHREYQKRIWIIHQKLSPKDTPARMMVHMTNTQLIPTMVWNEANLDLEWFYGPEPQQSKYAHDLLRTEALGRQAGCVPLVIAEVHDTKSDAEKERAFRTQFGAMMVHDIRTWNSGMAGRPEIKLLLDFGYTQPDCQVLNYWDDGYPVQASESDCKSLLLKRGGEALLLLTTWNGKPSTVDVRVDFPITSVEDAETKQPLTVANNSFAVPLDGYGVRLVRLK